MLKRIYEEGWMDHDEDVRLACRLVKRSTLDDRSKLDDSTEYNNPLSEGWKDESDCGDSKGENFINDDQLDILKHKRVEKRKQDEDHKHQREDVISLWNKLRWTSPETWNQVTTRTQTPHLLLLKYHISTHHKAFTFNSVQENILLVLKLLDK